MNVNASIIVKLKDVYQFLIDSCRYGYTRNNHLMPDGAYEKCIEYLPKVANEDPDYAAYIAKQLCEECISEQLVMNFYNGIDDEFNTRANAIDFIEYCLDFIKQYDEDFKPYNYDSYLENLKRDDDKIYWVAVETEEEGEWKLLSTEPVSVKDYMNLIAKDLGSDSFIYTRQRVYDENCDKSRHAFEGFDFYITEPKDIRYQVRIKR